jgi:BMFP domain-containing protein YqiC
VVAARCYQYREGSAVSFIDDRDKFRSAERRVRHMLFGDGVQEPGRLKGEEVREEVTRALRRMRESFDAVLARSEEGQERKTEVEARVADLEEELTRIARSKARRARSASTPKKARKRTPKRAR